MEFIIALIIWTIVLLTFAFLTYKVAEVNGRSGTIAFSMGLLFGWIALVVYAVIGKTPQKREEEKLK